MDGPEFLGIALRAAGVLADRLCLLRSLIGVLITFWISVWHESNDARMIFEWLLEWERGICVSVIPKEC